MSAVRDDAGAGDGAGRARTRQRLVLLLPIVAVVVAVDQLSKSWAVEHLAHRSVPVFWTLRFDLSFNSGLAFSQGRGLTDLITIAGLVLVAGLVWWVRTLTRPVLVIAAALLLGGAVGNLSDRLLRDHDGAVVDFIDLQWWPVFNVADIAITAGALMMVAASLREPHGADA